MSAPPVDSEEFPEDSQESDELIELEVLEDLSNEDFGELVGESDPDPEYAVDEEFSESVFEKEVPEDLVYYDIEDVFGNKTVYVYFFNPLDKQNFIHYYNTVYSIDKVTK